MFCENSSVKLSSLEVFFVEAFVCIDSVCFITIWLFRLSICSGVSFGILISFRRFVHIKCQIYRQKVIHNSLIILLTYIESVVTLPLPFLILVICVFFLMQVRVPEVY